MSNGEAAAAAALLYLAAMLYVWRQAMHQDARIININSKASGHFYGGPGSETTALPSCHRICHHEAEVVATKRGMKYSS